jgi:hypothetical protein
LKITGKKNEATYTQQAVQNVPQQHDYTVDWKVLEKIFARLLGSYLGPIK